MNAIETMIARTLGTRRPEGSGGGGAALRLAIQACGEEGKSLRVFAAQMDVSKTALINVLNGTASLTAEFALRASLAIEAFEAQTPRRGATEAKGAAAAGEGGVESTPPKDVGARRDTGLPGRRSSMTRVKRRALEWLRLEAEFAIDTALRAHIAARAAAPDASTAS